MSLCVWIGRLLLYLFLVCYRLYDFFSIFFLSHFFSYLNSLGVRHAATTQKGFLLFSGSSIAFHKRWSFSLWVYCTLDINDTQTCVVMIGASNFFQYFELIFFCCVLFCNHHIYLISYNLFMDLPSLNPVNTAAETVFCHSIVGRRFFSLHSQFNSIQCVWKKLSTEPKSYYTWCVPKKMLSVTKISTKYILFTLSGVFDM